MAHLCPECGMKCHCGGDVDDLCFDIASRYCCHCDDDEYDPDFPNGCLDEDFDDLDPNDSRNL